LRAAAVSSGSPVEVYMDWGHMDDSFIRVFCEELQSEELVWHRDKKDRIVEVVSGTGWKFQYDNNVPFELKRGMVLEIKAYSYHRILKGSTDLILRITEKNR
jgi:hypothetical protein